jgi:hypothetical protein
MEQYDARVLQALGVHDIFGALATQQASLAASRITLIPAERTELGRLVTIRVRPPEGADQRYSFLLRRQAQRWRIIYDSLLEGALAFFVQQRVQESSGKAKPTLKAIRAGRRAADRYATLFSESSQIRPPSGR